MGTRTRAAVRARIIIAILVAIIVVAGSWLSFSFARTSYRNLMSTQEETRLATQRTSLLVEGFRPESMRWNSGEPSRDRVLFIGHFYPRSGFWGGGRPAYPDRGRTRRALAAFVGRTRPARVVFGGDVVWSPSAAELRQLTGLKADFPNARLLLGNHDGYWGTLRHDTIAMSELYIDRFQHEDVRGVRAVYLHTVGEDGSYGLDPGQEMYLRTALQPDEYRYALVFLHHALWAGDTPLANTTYEGAVALRTQWLENILPILENGNVRAVFSGDGGWRAPGGRMFLGSIPHYVTGMSGWRGDILPEWISIGLGEDSIEVSWYRLLGEEVFERADSPGAGK